MTRPISAGRSWRTSRVGRPLKPTIIRSAVGVLVLLVAVELTLRLAGAWYLETHYYRPGLRGLHEHRETVVCLGESSTAGLWCAFDDSYPKQLERLVNERFHTDRFLAVVPPHVGQNTSQIANRVDSYIRLYHPRLIIVMSGVNNLWALGESSAGRFFHGSLKETLPLRVHIALSQFRVYKLLRYLLVRVGVRSADYATAQQLYAERLGFPATLDWSAHRRQAMDDLAHRYQCEMLGHPILADWPGPRREATAKLAQRYQMEAFLEGWRYDMRRLIRAAQQQHVPVLLMTYHIPGFPPVEEFVKMAEECHVPLVRNDLAFATLRQTPGFRPGDYLLQDQWHPNAKGYRLIAEDALAAIVEHHWLED